MKTNTRRLFILDTNVLMHDPTAIFRFQEHDIFLPMIVLEELDKGKKGMSEVSRNVRQVSRFLDELMAKIQKGDIDAGLPLPAPNSEPGEEQPEHGRLFFQTKVYPNALPENLPGNTPDNSILAFALALQQEQPERPVTLVSKDINLRIKAAVLGIHAEDYSSDQVLDDVNLLYRGFLELPADFWDSHSKELDAWQEEGHSFYRVMGPDIVDWYPNQCLYMEDGSGFQAIVRGKEDHQATIELLTDYSNPKHSVWGINARNREQNFALNMLMDPELDFISLLGQAGDRKSVV